MSRRTFAALDLGTNNCRLLIARERAETLDRLQQKEGFYASPFEIVDAFSRIVRLGEGLAAQGCLSENAIARTLSALAECAERMRGWGVTHARCIATEACRKARNGADFLRKVKERTGLSLEVISGEEEAVLALFSCLQLLDPDIPHALVFDIGGGSTEVSLLKQSPGEGFELLACRSMAFGVVRLAEDYKTGGDKATAKLDQVHYEIIKENVSASLTDFNREYRLSDLVRAGQLQLLGTSGTVTTLAALVQGLERYDRRTVDGSELTRAQLLSTIRVLQGKNDAWRAKLPCIGKKRADLVLPGCAILEAFLDLWPVEKLIIGDRGLREGLLYTLACVDEGVPT